MTQPCKPTAGKIRTTENPQVLRLRRAEGTSSSSGIAISVRQNALSFSRATNHRDSSCDRSSIDHWSSLDDRLPFDNKSCNHGRCQTQTRVDPVTSGRHHKYARNPEPPHSLIPVLREYWRQYKDAFYHRTLIQGLFWLSVSVLACCSVSEIGLSVRRSSSASCQHSSDSNPSSTGRDLVKRHRYTGRGGLLFGCSNQFSALAIFFHV